MLWSIGFLTTFLFGGLTGIILASPPLDFHVSDSYFVVAHFHYVVFGTVVFAMFAGFYFWWPKMTGRMLDERLGKVHFWLLFVGFHTTFLVQHWLGVEGMPRRYADYLQADGFTTLNQVSTIGAFLLGASTLPFLYNVYISRKAPLVEVDDPWGWGRSLEWATSCPPPRHNFVTIPRIRSESPAFDLHHPEVAAIELDQNEAAAEGGFADAPDMEGRDELIQERTEGEDERVKAEAWIFGGCTIFLVLVTPAYWLVTDASAQTERRRLDRHLRAGHDDAADADGHHLPRLPRQEDGPATRGPQGRRDRGRRRRAGLLPAVLLVAAVVRAGARRRASSASRWRPGGC